MAKTIGLVDRKTLPKDWVVCTAQRCEYVGSMPLHAHPIREGNLVRLSCGALMDLTDERTYLMQASILAIEVPLPGLLRAGQLAHENGERANELILRLAIHLFSDGLKVGVA